MKKTKNLEEFTRDLSFKLPRTVTGSPETRRKWRFSDDPWLPPSLLCSASLLLLLLLRLERSRRSGRRSSWWRAGGLKMVRGQVVRLGEEEGKQPRKKKKKKQGSKATPKRKENRGVGSCKPRIIWQISALVPEISWPQFFFIYK